MTQRGQSLYLLDANVLMTARHHYYAPELCPGFWDRLEHHRNAGRLLIIDGARDEVISPTQLAQWVEGGVRTRCAKRAPLPDRCRHFQIRCIDADEMLRELSARFDWRPLP